MCVDPDVYIRPPSSRTGPQQLLEQGNLSSCVRLGGLTYDSFGLGLKASALEAAASIMGHRS